MGDISEATLTRDRPSTMKEISEDDAVEITVERVELKRTMNLLHSVALLFSLTGHSAVFISPSAILKYSGSVGMCLIAWLISGIINMCLALCFVELGTMMPKAGGSYAFILNTFGSLPGFVILWGYLVLISGPFWAFQAKTAAVYVVKAIIPGCDVTEMEWGINLLGAWILVSLIVVNSVYMKLVTRVQTFLSSTKIVALLILIAGGIAMFAQGNSENFSPLFEGTSTDAGSISMGIFYALFGYGGWQVLLTMSEEVKNPGRVLPLSVFITFSIVIIKYILVNIAYFTLMSPAELISSRAVALMFTERLFPPLTPLMSFLVGTITMGALNGAIMGHSRLLFAGSRVGHAAVLFGMIHHKYLTPGPAIMLPAIWSLVMLFMGGFTTMMQYITLFSNIMSLMVIIALLYLRWKQPDVPRPYKVPLVIPISQIFIVVAILGLAVYHRPQQMGIAFVIMFLGLPVYYIVTWKNKPRFFVRFTEKFTVSVQKIFGVVKTS